MPDVKNLQAAQIALSEAMNTFVKTQAEQIKLQQAVARYQNTLKTGKDTTIAKNVQDVVEASNKLAPTIAKLAKMDKKMADANKSIADAQKALTKAAA